MRQAWTRGGILLGTLWLGACAPEEEAGLAREQEPVRAEASADGVEAVLELSPPRPTLTDAITLTLTVTSEPAVAVRMPEFTDRLGDFTVRGFTEPPEEQRGERIVRRQEYRLEPAAAGVQVVSPLPVGVPGAGDQAAYLVTDPLEVEVQTLAGDAAPRLADLAPAEGAVALEAARGPARWLPLAGGAVLAAAALVWWRRRRRRSVAAGPVLTPRELAEREFAALRDDDPLGRGEVKTWYVELTAIVRRYIERTDGIRAPELTTPEFLRALQRATEVPAQRRQALGVFLEAADLVKFAAHQPGRRDIEDSERHARGLVGLDAPADATERAA